ncbi:MAG: DUF2760 domain-containing protein [Verrucomicrobia bacterium]|jgi:hypothetical protein|nr:DUF2760 domain-containing protein [Verrucomicrobiota bacterium]MDA7510171.1 DUF2760 domain-containing protein [Verrucomicrobiota bacterium]MDA7667621.1 DUF2760 domain-containing protein [bacterium]
MKLVPFVLPTLTIVLSLTSFVPALQGRSHWFLGGLAVASVIHIVLSLGSSRTESKEGAGDPSRSKGIDTPELKPIVARPLPVVPSAEAQVVCLLASMQEKGRLIDFLMDDITAYEDAQVGAAARVVHQGCRAVLKEQFEILPVRSEAEGSAVTVPEERAHDDYRLTGNLKGQAPFTGTLVHKGWKTAAVKLPKPMVDPAAPNRLPTIAPAEVEIR